MLDLPTALADFDRYHRCRPNRICHYIGLSIITVAALGWLSWFALPVALPGSETPLDAGLVLLAATLAFDLWLYWRLAPAVLAAGLAAWLLGRALPGWALLALFVGGWVFQLVGHHHFERKSPAFTAHLVHLLIGPRWLVDQVLGIVPRPPADEPG